MKNKYSIFSLIKNAFSGHENWQRAWRDPEPKKEYDAIIIGGGGHGLATAYYLAKKHKITNIAVVEKGWIGGGNTGRNTTIIRSYYRCISPSITTTNPTFFDNCNISHFVFLS